MAEPSKTTNGSAPPDKSARQSISIKYTWHARCPKCRGSIAYDGTETRNYPIGFGFVRSKFQIDLALYRGFCGECIKCGQRIFAVRNVRHSTKYPRLRK